MNRLVQVLLTGSKALIVGACLAVLPWLGAMYFVSRTPDLKPAADSSLPDNMATAKLSSPGLLPTGDSLRCVLASESKPQPILAADFPAQQPDPLDSADGPVLAEPTQAEKPQSAYIPPSGIVAENKFDQLSANPSPPVWMPKEMPIAYPVTKPELSPAPQQSEAVANSDSSADSTPAAQNAAVDIQSEALAIEPGQIYPSTEPLLVKRAASKDLPVRSEQLESIARQADQQTRHGFELAGRGAYFAARSEFIAALRLVAQGLDTDGRTKIHGKSLAAGLTALKEAEDFIPSGSKLEADLDLAGIIAGHSTPVLKEAEKDSITTLSALKSYFTYSQEQFARAAGNEVAGSMALHALGKLHEEFAKRKDSSVKAAAQKAMAYYQASLLVCPQNFMAANDLGVMLARHGNYEDARKMLEHSLSMSNLSMVWQNLAVVYQRLGRADIAGQARHQALIARQTEQASRQKLVAGSSDQVRWVDERTFAKDSNSSGIPQRTTTPGPAATANPMMQQAQAGPMTPPTQGILQPLPNQYWPANANAAQTQSPVNRPLPVLRPANTSMLPNTPYDARR